MMRFFRLASLLLLFFSWGCSSHRNQTLRQPKVQEPRFTEETAPAADTAAGTDTLPAEGDTSIGGTGSVFLSAAADEPAAAPVASVESETAEADPPEPETDGEEAAVADEEAAVEIGEETVENGQTLLDAALDLVNSSQEYWSQGNQEKALSVLDEAYGLALKVDTEANPEFFQQKEDLRYLIS